MNIVVRKLSILKQTIDKKELNAKIKGRCLCSSDIKLKNNIEYLINKLSLS